MPLIGGIISIIVVFVVTAAFMCHFMNCFNVKFSLGKLRTGTISTLTEKTTTKSHNGISNGNCFSIRYVGSLKGGTKVKSDY